jgi:hypothetical protein
MTSNCPHAGSTSIVTAASVPKTTANLAPAIDIPPPAIAGNQ